MLSLNFQKRWVPWPEAGIELLLSPLTVSLRQRLMEEATETKGKRTAVNQKRFQDLVADNCVHDWKGVVMEGAAGAEPAPCTAEAKHAFIDLEPANVFVFITCQGLGMQILKEAKAAGNA